MSATGEAPLTAEQACQKALELDADASTLAQVSSDWTAVAIFYAAYHRVRAALLSDPIFDDPSRLARVNINLQMDDRNVTRHVGRWRWDNGARVKIWGINELVALLYPGIAADYEVLHQASIDVRYRQVLTKDIAGLQARGEAIRSAFDGGQLRCP